MIYLDYNATTPLDPEVADLVDHVSRTTPGNASSVQHGAGNDAARVSDRARRQVAQALDTSVSSVVWTSGASEGLHLAIVGLVGAAAPHKRTIVINATEHNAALNAAEFCRRLLGAEVRLVAPRSDGSASASGLAAAIDETVSAVVCMHVNNETGVINPVEEIGQVCHERSVPLVCDVTQSLGKVDVTSVLRVSDIAVFSAHKFYGPKGVGALIADASVRRRMVSALAGGGHGAGIRGGTVNTPGVAGLGLATELAVSRLTSSAEHYRAMSTSLLDALASRLGAVELIGAQAPRVSNTRNVRFRGADAEAVMANAQGVAISTGSACNAADAQPSHVLLAMGLDNEAASECIRFSVGLPTTPEEISLAAEQVSHAVERVRRLTAA